MRKISTQSAGNVTVQTLLARKAGGRKITTLTAYDYPTASLLDSVESLDIILVGDSLGNVILGYETTVPVTMDDMVHHTKAVRRGVNRALVVADMPFLSYQINEDETLRNAGRLIQEGGANAVKLEGGVHVAGAIKRIVDAGIPVIGHVGLLPQSVNLTGLKKQGKVTSDAERVLADALAVQEAGGSAVVLELIPEELAKKITSELTIPTIGIASGPHCDGQVLVLADMLGLDPDKTPLKHVRRYAEIGNAIRDAITAYCADVVGGEFP
jgi:3-methyl-2-oxobutanoate hydroxymethyltransferase